MNRIKYIWISFCFIRSYIKKWCHYKELYQKNDAKVISQRRLLLNLSLLQNNKNGYHYNFVIVINHNHMVKCFLYSFSCMKIDLFWSKLKRYVPSGPIDNKPPLVQKMAWCQRGDKPLSGPMTVYVTDAYIRTRPQWVNWHYKRMLQVNCMVNLFEMKEYCCHLKIMIL